jgi:hypothetical protein
VIAAKRIGDECHAFSIGEPVQLDYPVLCAVVDISFLLLLHLLLVEFSLSLSEWPLRMDFPQPNRETARCEQSPKR